MSCPYCGAAAGAPCQWGDRPYAVASVNAQPPCFGDIQAAEEARSGRWLVAKLVLGVPAILSLGYFLR